MKKSKEQWKAWALVNQFGMLLKVSNSLDEKPVKPGLVDSKHYRVIKVRIVAEKE